MAMNSACVAIYAACLLVSLSFMHAAWAAVDCATLPRWVRMENGVRLNQAHVFCGEESEGRAKGLHARPGGKNPATVRDFTIQDFPDSTGIYSGRWSHVRSPGRGKFSSMFPDNCSVDQILKSVSHASSHPERSCPPGAPGWIRCGRNRPADPAAGGLANYCSRDGTFFLIGFSEPWNGRINTAFPIRP